MTRRTPPFNALYAFIITAKHLNLTRAAKELYVTQSAVSRQIATLEDYLGYRVFLRHARGLSLTPDGEHLLPQIKTSFDTMIHATQPTQKINTAISLKAPTCSMRWLVPNLMALQEAYPAVNVSLTTTTDHTINFDIEEFDAAVVYSCQPIPLKNSIKLFDEALTPVIAKHLYSSKDTFELNHQTFLHPTKHKTDWRLWLSQTGLSSITMEKNQYFDTMDLAISAAIQGFGVAIADTSLIEEDVKMNRLIKPFSNEIKTGASYYLILRPDTRIHSELHHFIEWFS